MLMSPSKQLSFKLMRLKEIDEQSTIKEQASEHSDDLRVLKNPPRRISTLDDPQI
jgi:hypothetical protein